MVASDFILEASFELQEKNQDKKFWNNSELFIKLQRAYKQIQKDLPYFVASEQIDIKQGINLYHLKFRSIKEISFFINDKKYVYEELEELFDMPENKIYNISSKQLQISPIPIHDNKGIVSYYYLKELENENDYITTPIKYEEALRLLFLAYVFEKAPKDMTQRDLSIHYLKRYESAKELLKRSKKTKKFLTSKYQRI